MKPFNPRPQRPPVQHEAWAAHTQQLARHLPYPPTPELAATVVSRPPSPRTLRPAWVAAIGLALLLGLFAIPPVRAAVIDFLQVGAVRIWRGEPTPTPAPAPGAAQPPTPHPTPTPLHSLFNLAGATTLAEAEAAAGFKIRLPTIPADLGVPDGVFLQDITGPVVVLVWLDPANPDKAAYSLHIFGPGTFVTKMNPPTVFTATVNGREVAWLEGPYMLAYGDGSAEAWQARYLVSGRVLLWEEDGLTYRLESNLSFDEAIEMAESLE